MANYTIAYMPPLFDSLQLWHIEHELFDVHVYLPDWPRARIRSNPSDHFYPRISVSYLTSCHNPLIRRSHVSQYLPYWPDFWHRWLESSTGLSYLNYLGLRWHQQHGRHRLAYKSAVFAISFPNDKGCPLSVWQWSAFDGFLYKSTNSLRDS